MDKQTMNRLDRKEMRVLENLVEQHSTEIKAGRWTRESFAQFATKTIGRPVTTSNVAYACGTMEVTFPHNRSVAALQSTRQLRKAVCLLSGEIARLCGELGAVCSPEVLELAKTCESEAE